MYDTEREALITQYQDASEKLSLLACKQLAEEVRSIWPTAAQVELERTDQGDTYQVIGGILDADGNELGDGTGYDNAGFEEMETAGNLHEERAGSAAWQAYCFPNPRPSRQDFVLDVERALTIDPAGFTPGDESGLGSAVLDALVDAVADRTGKDASEVLADLRDFADPDLAWELVGGPAVDNLEDRLYSPEKFSR